METLFFYASKILWALLAPDAFLVYLLAAGVLCLYMHKLRVAKLLLLASLTLFVIIAVLPVGLWLLYPLEKRFPANPPLPAKVDGIVLLGGTIRPAVSAAWEQNELGSSAEREIAFVELAREYPQAKLLMTGGNGALLDQQYREADFSLSLLQTLGVDPHRVVFERNARNTYENAVNSQPLMQPRAGETWLLVTSAYHMPRSVGIFCKQGWPVLPWPVDHYTAPKDLTRLDPNLGNNLSLLRVALREWTGLAVYYLTDKTFSLLPDVCPMEK